MVSCGRECMQLIDCAQDFRLLRAMGALEVEARLLDEFTDESAWAVLHDRWQHGGQCR